MQIFKKNLARITSLFLLVILFLSFSNISYAAAALPPLVPCNGADECNFGKFIEMINNIINWFVGIAISVFTISAIWGGFLYMTSGSNPGNKEKAKTILWNTFLGFVIILTSWLIVYTIIVNLVDTSQQGSVLKFLK